MPSSYAFCPSENRSRRGPKQALKLLWARGRRGGGLSKTGQRLEQLRSREKLLPTPGGSEDPSGPRAAHLSELILMNPVASTGS